jgi:hypothetical protein
MYGEQGPAWRSATGLSALCAAAYGIVQRQTNE